MRPGHLEAPEAWIISSRMFTVDAIPAAPGKASQCSSFWDQGCIGLFIVAIGVAPLLFHFDSATPSLSSLFSMFSQRQGDKCTLRFTAVLWRFQTADGHKVGSNSLSLAPYYSIRVSELCKCPRLRWFAWVNHHLVSKKIFTTYMSQSYLLHLRWEIVE